MDKMPHIFCLDIFGVRQVMSGAHAGWIYYISMQDVRDRVLRKRSSAEQKSTKIQNSERIIIRFHRLLKGCAGFSSITHLRRSTKNTYEINKLLKLNNNANSP